MIDVALLGTAALMPLPNRALTAATLSCSGRRILFDCGEGTQTAARRAGVGLMNVDIVALTHFHGDHIFGLPGLLQSMAVLGRAAPLSIVGPEGLEQAMAPVLRLAGVLPYAVRLLRLPPDGLSMGEACDGWPRGARLRAFTTEHRGPSQGYAFTLARAPRFLPDRAEALGVPVGMWRRLQAGEPVRVGEREVLPGEVTGEPRRGLKFVFSGDTAPCPALEQASRGADLLICEATFAEDADAEAANACGHMVFFQAGALAAAAGVKRLWLCHYSQTIGDPSSHIGRARAHFPGVVCGEDGMKAALRFEG